MSNNTQQRVARRPGRLATLATIAMLALAPVATRVANAEVTEESGSPGTDFVKCQNNSWADYNKCLMDATFSWEKKLCDLAFEGNIAWCASVYYARLKTGT